MGNRKYQADNGHTPGSDYAYDNPIGPAVSSVNGISVGADKPNGVHTSNGGTHLGNGQKKTQKELRGERLTSVSKVEGHDPDFRVGGGDPDTKYGWLWCRPSCLQVLNNPLGYCLMICLVTLIQGMTAFGLVFISLSTLEKRFFLNSLQSGGISSAYDFSTLIVAVCVGYMGERGNRPLWVGFGSMLYCAGSIIFAIPHFATPNYVYQETGDDFCGLPNQTDACSDVTGTESVNLSLYYWFFITAQVLHGIGSSPLYTLGVAYVDENVSPRQFGIFMGVYQAVVVSGPSIGYIVGGMFLKIYTDINVDTSSLTIDDNSPLWVGAWWMGFLINGAILCVLTFLYMGYPKTLPGGEKVREERRSETQKGREFSAEEGVVNQFRALPRAVCTLLTNVPFMCLNGAAITTFFLIAGFGAFGPKYLESQFSLTPSDSAVVIGILSVTGGISGALFAGIIINRLDLSFTGLIKLGLIGACVSLCACGVFFASCPTVDFAGVTVRYENTSQPYDDVFQLNATCNSRCTCSGSYDPVCGSDGVMYYSACHAGCGSIEYSEHGEPIAVDCLCVHHNTSSPTGNGTVVDVPGTVVAGTCATSCPYKWLNYIGWFMIVSSSALSGVTGWTATIRCVSHSQRAFAMGVQTLMYGLIGSVPGPIVFGAMLDGSCLLWESSCDGSSTCWLYDNASSSRGFLILSAACEFLTAFFLLLVLLAYKAPTSTDDHSSDLNQEAFASHDELDTIA